MVDTLLNTLKYTLLAMGITFSMLAAKMANAEDIQFIPVAKERIQRGDIITADMLKMKPYQNRRLPRNAVYFMDEATGLEATRSIRAGYPIQARFLRIPPDNRKGEMITIQYKKSGLTLQSAGKLMQDADVGETVDVQSLSSRRILTGKVVSKSLVQVH